MADILITHNKHRACVVGLTETGNTWIKDNMDGMDGEGSPAGVHIDYMQDVVDAILKDGLDVEVR